MTEHPSRRMGNNLNIEFSILENPWNCAWNFEGIRRWKWEFRFPLHSGAFTPAPSPRRSKFPPRLKLYLHEGGRGKSVEKDDRSPRLFPCVHTMLVTSRGRYLVTGSDGLENRSRRNRQGVEEGKEGRVESVFSPSLSFVEIFVSNLLQGSINHAF